MNFKKNSRICKCVCLVQIVATAPQTWCSLMHFDMLTREVVNELQSLSGMFDQKGTVTILPGLIHKKKGMEEINASVSSL